MTREEMEWMNWLDFIFIFCFAIAQARVVWGRVVSCPDLCQTNSMKIAFTQLVSNFSTRTLKLMVKSIRYSKCAKCKHTQNTKWNCFSFDYFRCWDTAGQERFKTLRTPFYRGSDVCLLTYAVNDRDSFRCLKHWREEFIKYADVDGSSFPFIVVGNKVRQMCFQSVQNIHKWSDCEVARIDAVHRVQWGSEIESIDIIDYMIWVV